MQSSRHDSSWLRVRVLTGFFAGFAAIASASVACSTAELEQRTPDDAGPASTSTTDPPSPDGDVADAGTDPDDATSRDPDAATFDVPVSSNVTIQVQPSDNGAAVLAAIKGAKKSVHMTMYLLTNTDVQNALVTLKKAGKDVKVVLNKSFPPNGGDNTPSFTKLKNAGVPVVWAPPGYTFTHAKTIVIDGEKVLIMTMNLTAKADNREFIATDSDPADVADAETVFAADFASKGVTLGGKLIFSPKGAQAEDPRMRLVALMGLAKTSLDVEVQSLSDVGVVDAIIAAKGRGVATRVVTTAAGDREESPAQTNTLAKLKQAGVGVVGLGSPYNHAKAVVVDGKLAFVGSQNFTSTALFNNREVGVVTDAASEVAKVADVIAQDFKNGTPR